MSAKLYEIIGRKQERIEELDGAYTNLLHVLANVVAGQIARSRLLVNLTDRSWSLAPEGETPPAPATINGVPICVVAPPEPEAQAPTPAEPGNGRAERFAAALEEPEV